MTRSPRSSGQIALVLGLLVVATFPDVLFGGRTLSPAAYAPGIDPAGPVTPTDAPPTPHLRDVEGAAWVDEPSPYLVNRALAAGRLPLWNAAEGLGAPLAANLNAAAWAPLALPVNLHPTPLVQDLVWMVRVWVLGLAVALLARRLGCGPIAAIGGATALMLSGETLDWIAHHPLHSDVFIVLALASAFDVVSGQVGRAPLVVLAVAAALAGGKPQSAVVGALSGALWLVAAAVDRDSRPRVAVAALLRVTLAVVLGVALAAFVLVPFAETYAEASPLVRAGRMSQSAWRLPLDGILTLFGAPLAGLVTSLRRAPGALPVPVELTLPRAGLTVVVCALVGLVRARRRAVAWALALTVFLYLAKMGLGFPAWLDHLPLLAGVSWVKYSFPFYLALALLAGLGIDGGPAGRDAATTAPAISPGAQRGGGTGAARTPGRDRAPTGGALVPTLVAAAIAAELLFLAPRRHPLRVDPYAASPYLDALRELERARPGRIAGPIDLVPPLVSNAAGLRDLRAIDVLTPGATYDFFSELVAPSQGVSWILADPDPLLVATAAGSDLADVRYVLSRRALDAAALGAAVRSHVSALRLVRLWRVLEGYQIATASLWGGIDAFGEDRRFHWTCALPCRLRFELRELPVQFALGLAALEPLEVDVSLRLSTTAPDAWHSAASAHVSLGPEARRWHDLWIEDAGRTAARGTIEIELDGPPGRSVFVGGVGPSPGNDVEETGYRRELDARRTAFTALELRYTDATATIYENTRALGRAYVARELVRLPDAAHAYDYLRTAQGRRVAVVTDADLAAANRADLPSVSSGDAEVLGDDDERVLVATRSGDGGMLVVPRVFFPGWMATLDGAATSIVRVDTALVGVVVPPGEHRVELVYRPASLRVGAALSLVAALAWVVLTVVTRGARRVEGPVGRR